MPSGRIQVRLLLGSSSLEERSLCRVRRQLDRPVVGGGRLVRPPRSSEQVGVHRVEGLVGGQVDRRRWPRTPGGPHRGRAARRPRRPGSARPPALGCTAASWSYRATICPQSVCSAVIASAWTAAIAAWIWNGPGRLRRKHARTSAWPSVICSRFHARAILLGQPDHRAVRVRPGFAPRVREQHECEQSHRFGLVGHQLDEHPTETDGLRREIGARRAGRRWSRCGPP